MVEMSCHGEASQTLIIILPYVTVSQLHYIKVSQCHGVYDSDFLPLPIRQLGNICGVEGMGHHVACRGVCMPKKVFTFIKY